MNIFILDNDPIKAAQLQCDKHIPKMVVESAQMLSTVHRMIDGAMERRPSKSGSMLQYFKLDDYREDILYKAVHMNHPCTVWSRENCSNYDWHYKHFIALCNEYTYRYGKIHASETKLATVLRNAPKKIEHTTGKSPFRLAMGSNPECMFEDAVKSYRAFYQTKQARFAMKWTKRKQPEWFNAII
tara:strand:- start:377 stop:931 length:555 start_codon:yes stop_codon:yes gene_type:complete